jgi:alkaline phosphatase D
VAGGAGAAAPGAALPAGPPLLVAVGDVADRGAVLWLRTAGPGVAEIEVGPADGPARRIEARPTPGADHTARVRLEGLRPGARHAYRVRWDGHTAAGEFVTAPEPERAAPVVLLWSGDLGGSGRCRTAGVGYHIFRAMAARRPDFFVFLGDTVYADGRCRVPPNAPGADFRAEDLVGFRAKHRYQREDPALGAFLAGTSVYAVWDDHEVRGDFAGPSEPLTAAGLRAFLDYWPIAPPAEEPTRLYRAARWGRLVELFVLDTRQYRSRNTDPDGPGKTMLGAAQRRWLVDGLARSGAEWKLVATSVPLSVGTGRAARDGWASTANPLDPAGDDTGFEHELLGIVREIAARHVRNVVWLAADVHWAGVVRLAPAPGVTFHELIAGPLQAGRAVPRFFDRTLAPAPLFVEGGYDNFGEVRADERGLTVRIIDAAGQERFATTLAPAPPS